MYKLGVILCVMIRGAPTVINSYDFIWSVSAVPVCDSLASI